MAQCVPSGADAGARQAFIHTLRAVLDFGGQRVSATDRLYLAALLPSLIMWGGQDPLIPVEHATVAIGPEGGIWYCREYVTDFAHSGQIRRIVSTASSSVDNASHPVAFARPYPLPSTGSVQFDWSIAHAARVSLAILDVRGRLVRAVAVPRALPVGHHHAIWDGLDSYGRAVQPGIYFARLEVDGTSLEQRVLIVR